MTMPHTALPVLITQNIDVFACPSCKGTLAVSDNGQSATCSKCCCSYDCEDGIPLLFHPTGAPETDVTGTVKLFYEENPFPGYEDMDSDQSLRQKAEKGVFVSLLDKQIPHNAKILEVGCGTGQLSNYLGLTWGRQVFASDMCLNSLKLGQDFKKRHNITNVVFLQMNLFKPAFRPETFDLVICNGVLHHTSDPLAGLKSMTRLTKRGGFVLVGLYNQFGRIPTDFRRFVFKATGNRFKFLDTKLMSEDTEARKQVWFVDQYQHPHESKHTIGETLNWFDQSGIEFINSIPKTKAFEAFSPAEDLFKANPRGGPVDHFLVQLGMLCSGSEGGLFVMIGRRR